jgi:hypothetical protein
VARNGSSLGEDMTGRNRVGHSRSRRLPIQKVRTTKTLALTYPSVPITRSIGGCLRFFTLTQSFDLPP